MKLNCIYVLYECDCRHLEHVLKEIEEKTPVLQQQQIEYQTMVTSQQRLSRMYASASE